jgi:hypothetical protein
MTCNQKDRSSPWLRLLDCVLENGVVRKFVLLANENEVGGSRVQLQEIDVTKVDK